MQAWFEAYCNDDAATVKMIISEMKTVCNVCWGDGQNMLVYIKPFGATQTKQRMTGYVRKDRNLASFRNRCKNVSQEMIDAGIAEHASLKLNPNDGKIMLNKSNLFQKACAAHGTRGVVRARASDST